MTYEEILLDILKNCPNSRCDLVIETSEGIVFGWIIIDSVVLLKMPAQTREEVCKHILRDTLEYGLECGRRKTIENITTKEK